MAARDFTPTGNPALDRAAREAVWAALRDCFSTDGHQDRLLVEDRLALRRKLHDLDWRLGNPGNTGEWGLAMVSRSGEVTPVVLDAYTDRQPYRWSTRAEAASYAAELNGKAGHDLWKPHHFEPIPGAGATTIARAA